jgi:hypothetical protein
MVTTPSTIDATRVPTINLNREEIAEIEIKMAEGKLPKDYLDRHFDAVDANVHGWDAPKDRNGFRLEQGLGSPNNQTANSIAAFVKYHGPDAVEPDPNFAENLKKMQAQLAKSDEVRKVKAAKDGRRLHAGRP